MNQEGPSSSFILSRRISSICIPTPSLSCPTGGSRSTPPRWPASAALRQQRTFRTPAPPSDWPLPRRRPRPRRSAHLHFRAGPAPEAVTTRTARLGSAQGKAFFRHGHEHRVAADRCELRQRNRRRRPNHALLKADGDPERPVGQGEQLGSVHLEGQRRKIAQSAPAVRQDEQPRPTAGDQPRLPREPVG